jgi:hypothetical protein
LSSPAGEDALESSRLELAESCKQLSRVVSNVLEAERFQIGVAVFEQQSICLAKLLDFVATSIGNNFRSFFVLPQELVEYGSFVVDCDPERIVQALSSCLRAFIRTSQAETKVHVFVKVVPRAAQSAGLQDLALTEQERQNGNVEIGFEVGADADLQRFMLVAMSSSLEDAMRAEETDNCAKYLSFSHLPLQSMRLVSAVLELGVVYEIASRHNGLVNTMLLDADVVRISISIPFSHCQLEQSDSAVQPRLAIEAEPCAVKGRAKLAFPTCRDFAKEALSRIVELSAKLTVSEPSSGAIKPSKKSIRIRSNAARLLRMLDELAIFEILSRPFVDLELEEISIAALMAEVHLEYRERAENPSFEFVDQSYGLSLLGSSDLAKRAIAGCVSAVLESISVFNKKFTDLSVAQGIEIVLHAQRLEEKVVCRVTWSSVNSAEAMFDHSAADCFAGKISRSVALRLRLAQLAASHQGGALQVACDADGCLSCQITFRVC